MSSVPRLYYVPIWGQYYMLQIETLVFFVFGFTVQSLVGIVMFSNVLHGAHYTT